MVNKTKTAEEIWNNTGFIDDYKITDIKNQLDFAVIQSMETYATQEREKAVNEFKQRLIKAITSEVNFDDGYDSILSVQNIIEKLK